MENSRASPLDSISLFILCNWYCSLILFLLLFLKSTNKPSLPSFNEVNSTALDHSYWADGITTDASSFPPLLLQFCKFCKFWTQKDTGWLERAFSLLDVDAMFEGSSGPKMTFLQEVFYEEWDETCPPLLAPSPMSGPSFLFRLPSKLFLIISMFLTSGRRFLDRVVTNLYFTLFSFSFFSFSFWPVLVAETYISVSSSRCGVGGPLPIQTLWLWLSQAAKTKLHGAPMCDDLPGIEWTLSVLHYYFKENTKWFVVYDVIHTITGETSLVFVQLCVCCHYNQCLSFCSYMHTGLVFVLQFCNICKFGTFLYPCAEGLIRLFPWHGTCTFHSVSIVLFDCYRCTTVRSCTKGAVPDGFITRVQNSDHKM